MSRKSYTLSEVFEELQKDDKAEFECIDIGKMKQVLKRSNSKKYIDFKSYYSDGTMVPFKMGQFDENVEIDSKWYKVEKPVNHEKALEAFLNGKDIKCFYKDNWSFYKHHTNLHNPINRILICEILYGTWYIQG